ncbi:acyltransferase family protein [[Clostridium] aminophilum]|uniref:acyltransferase family protein n=1 Tax=[Clostridium] aminophilum TaxID=1526 RepID=UPI003F9D87B3
MNRSPYWDIVKGIGILAIVIGHTGLAHRFLYLFHVALFFFITGFLYNEKKYAGNPWGYFAARVRGVWPRYMVYTAFFALIHNFCVTRGIYRDQPIYSLPQILGSIFTSVTFQCPEPLHGALWFVPVWITSAALFGGCVWAGNALSAKFNRAPSANDCAPAKDRAETCSDFAAEKPAKLRRCTSLSAGIFAMFFGLLGLLLAAGAVTLPLNMHAAALAVPLYWMAWMIQKYRPDYRKFMFLPGWIVSGVFLEIMQRISCRVNVAVLNIPGVLYYLFSLVGAYHVLSLADFLEKHRLLRPLSNMMATFGKYSFDIMALHFAVFKMIDLLYCRLILHASPDGLSSLPVGFRFLTPVYIAAGVLIPTLSGTVLDQIKRKYH